MKAVLVKCKTLLSAKKKKKKKKKNRLSHLIQKNSFDQIERRIFAYCDSFGSSWDCDLDFVMSRDLDSLCVCVCMCVCVCVCVLIILKSYAF